MSSKFSSCSSHSASRSPDRVPIRCGKWSATGAAACFARRTWIVPANKRNPEAGVMDKQFIAKIVKFAISGGTAVVVNLALLYAFVDWLHIWYLTASVFAFVFSMAVHFSMQKLWVFTHHKAEDVHVQFT